MPVSAQVILDGTERHDRLHRRASESGLQTLECVSLGVPEASLWSALENFNTGGVSLEASLWSVSADFV